MTEVTIPNIERPIYNAAVGYIRGGWRVIPVYGLTTDGMCMCRQGSRCPPRMRGKHPVGKGWQDQENSLADAYAIWAEPDIPPNLGILTGTGSGIFALDVDVDAGGLESLATLIEQHGPLPPTRQHITGSGGRHFLFRLPPGARIRNSWARLGPGLDIRGTGGMIVAPPSVSGRGAYLIALDAEPLDPPAWLIEEASGDRASEPAPATQIEGLPAYVDLDPAERARVQHYAEEAVRRCVRTYIDAPAGTGNIALFTQACGALEVAQSPWNLVTRDEVWHAMEAATLRRRERLPGRGQDQEEFRRTFTSAEHRVVGRGRPLPADRDGSLILPIPAGDTANSDTAGGDAPDGGTDGAVPIVDRPTALQRLRGRLHDRDQLDGIPEPVPLIERVVDVGALCVVAGQFGTYKTFVTLGWAAALATGTGWLGCAVPAARPVLYVAAEGASGLKSRLAAWEERAGVRVPRGMLHVLDIPVALREDEQCSALLSIARELDVGMVVFDTLHRCAARLDENSSTDMSRLTEVADALREHVNGCATVFAHHTGHVGTRSRGASSIEDDADCVWISQLVGSDGSRDPSRPRRLEQRKTKDSAQLPGFLVRLDMVGQTNSGVLSAIDETGTPVNVPDLASPFRQPRSQATRDQIRERIKEETGTNSGLILNMFLDVFGEWPDGVTEAHMRAVCKERYAHHPGWAGNGFRTTFARAWGHLRAEGVIEQGAGNRWVVVPVEDRPQRTVFTSPVDCDD